MIIFVHHTQINDNPFQKRREYGDITELAADIAHQRRHRPATRGLIYPPTGRLLFRNATEPHGRVLDSDQIAIFVSADGRLSRDAALVVQTETGHRRLRALQHLAETAVPGYEDGYAPMVLAAASDDQMIDAVYAENAKRKELMSVEEAELIAAKLAMPHSDGSARSQRDVAEEWNLNRATIANKMRLLKLPPVIQEANRRGDLSERQCLSLAQIADLDNLIGEDIKWGKDMGGNRWDKPASPEKYIEHVLAHPEITSDQMREMGKRMIDHAGRPLPDVIAGHDFAPTLLDGGSLPGLQQYTCKGCPFRFNSTCLSPDCLTVKERVFGNGVARAAAEELGLPFSDKPKHFALERPEREKLLAYYNGGGRQDVVVGWLGAGEYGARPFHSNSWLHSEDVYKNGGRGGVALGHPTGNVPAVAEEVEDVADKATVAGWHKRAQKRRTAVSKRAKEAMAEKLAGADTRLLVAFMSKGEVEIGDDPGQWEKAVVDYLWDTGRWQGYSGSDNLPGEIENIGKVLDKAGIGRAALAAPDKFADLAERTVMWLDFWYHYREYHWLKNRWEEAKAAIGDLRREFEVLGVAATGGELLELGLELDRAARDIEAKLANQK